MSNLVFIYTLSDPFTGQVRYVGKSNYPNKRLTNHLANKNTTHTTNWIRALQKVNARPILEIVDTIDKSQWEFWEKYWISQFKTWGFELTNHQTGGGSDATGKTRPNKPWNTGKKLPLSTREKMSASQKRREYSYQVGRKQSKETIEKRVSKMRGVLHTNAKLNTTQVSEIRNSCLTNTILAQKYNISLRSIYKIKAKEVYKY